MFRQKLLDEDGGVMTGVVTVEKQGLFSPKVGATSSLVFTQSPQNFAVEAGIHTFNRFFALLQLLYR
jgi:pyruvate/oxaloacetate carboxyltransferase